jgi:hypothetical protein
VGTGMYVSVICISSNDVDCYQQCLSNAFTNRDRKS